MMAKMTTVRHNCAVYSYTMSFPVPAAPEAGKYFGGGL